MIDILIPSCKPYEEIEKQIKEIESSTPEEHRIVAQCEKKSAAKNRNIAHSKAISDFIIMLDDDIKGFYFGWVSDLINPLLSNTNIVFSSARLISEDGNFASMMHTRFLTDLSCEFVPACPTACFAYRKADLDSLIKFHNEDSLPFDESFVGSGWEDTALCADLKKKYPHSQFVIVNKCKLIHLNEMKNQHVNNTYKRNKQYYDKSGRKRI